MKFSLRWAGAFLGYLLPTLTLAQLTVTSPVPRMVFQRNLANEAIVTVTGMAPPTATTVEARFVPMAVGQGAVTALDTLTPSAEFFCLPGQSDGSSGLVSPGCAGERPVQRL